MRAESFVQRIYISTIPRNLETFDQILGDNLVIAGNLFLQDAGGAIHPSEEDAVDEVDGDAESLLVLRNQKAFLFL